MNTETNPDLQMFYDIVDEEIENEVLKDILKDDASRSHYLIDMLFNHIDDTREKFEQLEAKIDALNELVKAQ